MITDSLWNKYSLMTDFPTLSSDIQVDVAIVGAGITGLTCAQLLSSQGLSVALLEAGKVGESNTGHSTGNIYSAYGELLNNIEPKFGIKATEQILQSRREAMDFIAQNIDELNIDCDFQRVPWMYFSMKEDMNTHIAKARLHANKLNVQFDEADFSGTPFNALDGIKISDQAQMNPLRYAQGMALAISCQDCLIFEKTRVTKIEDHRHHSVVHTPQGKVSATYVIHATHTPKGLMSYHTTLGPYREYGLACKVRELKLQPGIYFGYIEGNEVTSFRTYEREGDEYIILVGKPHKVGQGDSEGHMRDLEKIARSYFDVKEIAFRWGGQNYKPADEVPYIGRKMKGTNTFIATGFSTHGLTYGTVAGKIISDLITNQSNEFADVYDPGRFTPVKAAPKFIKENVNVFFQYLKDYTKENPKLFADVSAGEGKVIEHDGEKLAVHRDNENKLQVCSAICTHLGCVVHWNNAESSWDCPCHGSRFDLQGEVLEGPALSPLKQIEISDDKTREEKRKEDDRNQETEHRV